MIASALSIASVLVYLLLGGSEFLQPRVPVHTYLPDLSGLTKEAPVRFNGIRVGSVTGVELSHLTDAQKVVRVDISIVQRYLHDIPQDSSVEVTADNLLGDRFANINEGKSSTPLQPGAELQRTPPLQINMADLMKAARDIIASTDALFADIQAGRGSVGEFIKSDAFYNDTLKKVLEFQRQIHEVTARNSQVGKLIYDESLYDQLRAPVTRLNQLLADLGSGQGVGGKFLKDPAQYDQLRKTVRDLNQQLADIEAGKGPAGKLLKDDEPYLRIVRMIDNLNKQVDALNSGEGALGHLMVTSTLYENLNGETKSLRNMLKELRENPKKFLRLKVF
jgi:phospholipid/cholesterol/gamma-HCH transport system substrate-binding protein